MALLAEEKASIVSKFQKNDSDTGSPEVQIALLTENIKQFVGYVIMKPIASVSS